MYFYNWINAITNMLARHLNLYIFNLQSLADGINCAQSGNKRNRGALSQ